MKIYIILLLFLYSCSATGQQLVGNNGFIVPYEEFAILYADSVLAANPSITKIIFLENDVLGIYKSIKHDKIRVLTRKEIKKTYRKTKKPVSVICVNPLRLYNGLFIVNLTEEEVTAKKRNYYFSIGGGKVFQFDFDCQTRKLIFKGSRQWGV